MIAKIIFPILVATCVLVEANPSISRGNTNNEISNGDHDIHDSIQNQPNLSGFEGISNGSPAGEDSGKYQNEFAPGDLGDNQNILNENKAIAELNEQNEPDVENEDDGDDDDDNSNSDDDEDEDEVCFCYCRCGELSESDESEESDSSEELNTTFPPTESATASNSSEITTSSEGTTQSSLNSSEITISSEDTTQSSLNSTQAINKA